jgi:putative transposase
MAFDLRIKMLAMGVNAQGRVYTVGGCNRHRWYNHQLDKIRSKRDRCQQRSRRRIHRSQVYQRVSEHQRNQQRDCLHKAARLIAHRLLESAVVIGALSQRRMVMKAHQEKRRQRKRNASATQAQRKRAVCNDWGLDGLAQRLEDRWRRCGQDLQRLDARSPSPERSRCGQRQTMPLGKRRDRCGNGGLVMDRDGNSAITIRQRFLARLGPHTGQPVRCAASQAQQSNSF